MARPPRKRKRSTSSAGTLPRQSNARQPIPRQRILIAATLLTGIAGITYTMMRMNRERPSRTVSVATFEVPAGIADPAVQKLLRTKVECANQQPTTPEAVGELAAAYEACGFWTHAYDAYDAAVMLAPDNPAWLLHRAIAARGAKGFDAHIQELANMAGRFPNDAPVQHRYGNAAMEAGDFDVAEAAFTAARNAAPDAAEPLIGLATVSLQTGNTKAALQFAEEALRRDNDVEIAHYLRGRALVGQGRLDEAAVELARGTGAQVRYMRDALATTIERYRVDRISRIQLAGQRLRAGHVDQAVTSLQQLAAEFPSDPDIAANLGAAFLQQGDLRRAEASLRAALAEHGNQPVTMRTLAACLLKQDRLNEARAVIDRAVTAAPFNADIRLTRSIVLARLKQHEAALRDLEAAVRFDPAHADAHFALATVYRESGKVSDARTLFERMTTIAPADLRGMVGLAQLALENGDRETARRLLLRAELIDPKSDVIRDLAIALRDSSEQNP
ncbi:MAG: tetratricopeptide repeat protein [Phycisphaerae bacterium]